MNEQLLLDNIRSVLIRQEETIIFALIERAQFGRNQIVYQPNAVGAATGGESLVGYLLRETERIHARMRRYTSPDEHPFYANLPQPILPPLSYNENPLRPNDVNLNSRIREVYENEIISYICPVEDDGQYGSSAVCDVNGLQALSKRIHYGKFVAESKYQAQPARFGILIRRKDLPGILAEITDERVETKVLERVRLKTKTYGQDLGGNAMQSKIDADCVVEVYRRWIIPLTKDVEVKYLLERSDQ